MPFKMMGKSPLMKKLVGNQSRLPENLKAAIKAAPGKMVSPLKKDKKTNVTDNVYGTPEEIAENQRIQDKKLKELGNYFELPYLTPRSYKDEKAELKKQTAAEKLGPVLDGLPKSKFSKTAYETMQANQPTGSNKDFESVIKGNTSDIISSSKNNSVGEFKKRTDSNTAEKTQQLLNDKERVSSNSSVGLQKSSIDPYNFSTSNRFNRDNGVAEGLALGKKLEVTTSTPPVSENIKNNVTDKVQVGSGSTKRLPIDAMQDRLTKNIDRRTRKSDVRKQTRTAKQASRQEGSTRKEARDKVGKLGINPNTGKSFDNAKQKQDFINAKGKDTFVSDLQKKASKTMKKAGIDPSTSNKKVSSTKVAKKESKPLETKPLPDVPNIKKVPVSKRPALYDDGYDQREEENNRMNKIMKTPNKMMKKAPSKMMKKAPSKMMKKAAAPKMMKKAPAKMMKKKKK